MSGGQRKAQQHPGLDSDRGPVLIANKMDYAGPTKRSADVNDFVALESEIARERAEVEKVRAQIEEARRRERRLVVELDELRRIRALLDEIEDDVDPYVAARGIIEAERRDPPKQHSSRSMSAIDAGLDWIRLAVKIANRVVDGILAGPQAGSREPTKPPK